MHAMVLKILFIPPGTFGKVASNILVLIKQYNNRITLIITTNNNFIC